MNNMEQPINPPEENPKESLFEQIEALKAKVTEGTATEDDTHRLQLLQQASIKESFNS